MYIILSRVFCNGSESGDKKAQFMQGLDKRNSNNDEEHIRPKKNKLKKRVGYAMKQDVQDGLVRNYFLSMAQFCQRVI